MPASEQPSDESERRYPILEGEAKERVLEAVRQSLAVDRVHLRPPLQNGPSPETSPVKNRTTELPQG